MEICEQIDVLLQLLNEEEARAKSFGYSTVTLTREELKKLTDALVQINDQVVNESGQAAWLKSPISFAG